MKNLESIEYKIMLDDEAIEGSYLLEKVQINDHCSLVSAIGTSVTKGESEEEISYLKFSRSVDNNSTRTVDIAFPVKVNEDGTYECQSPKNPYISVYFPTETESKLGFIVQGPYRTTPNRSSIPADDLDNIRLAKETAFLLRQTILELKNAGKFNMSFVKVLPLSRDNFENFALFYPLYEMVENLFMCESIIPCKNGGYIPAEKAKIARQEKLATLFSDELLTDLFHDGLNYKWLPTYLTETNREYEAVYKYLVNVLEISVIRPEDLRIYFNANPNFLPKQSNEWLIQLYGILENVGAAFSRNRYESNMLTANIIKTSTGEFVSAYRRTDNRQYIPNVFLPTDTIQTTDIHFVDPKIYQSCRRFFDDILQLQKPNEYEFFIKDIEKRYSERYVFEEDKHIDDFQRLIKYLGYGEYTDEVSRIIKDYFVIRCNDGVMRNPHMIRVFLPINQDSINIEGYLKNIAKNVYFVDAAFYTSHGITLDMLCLIGVNSSLLYNENIVAGLYDNGGRGRQPEWWTSGDFRWKLTIEYLKDAIKYISLHPTAKDSIIKSKTIISLLLENESKLIGTVRIGGNTPNLDDEPCEMIKVLRGERTRDWNGKWLFTEALELVSPKSVSKHDISISIYGKIKPDSIVYELLGFKKTASDEVDDLKKAIPQKQLDAFFENELKIRFGITTADLTEKFAIKGTLDDDLDDLTYYPFPIARVKNMESLKKHAAEMLCYANPVKYEYVVRKIRVSNPVKEAKAYLLNMYRYDGMYKYACQMCHDSCSNIEIAQIFNKPETELDPMNLCLCPNCAAKYRLMRNDTDIMEDFKTALLELKENEITEDDYVSISVDDEEIWFTQVHIAEIQALLKLSSDALKGDAAVVEKEEDDEGGLSVYSAYVGKQITRKDGFCGEIISVSDDYLEIKIIKSKDKQPGELTKVQLSFLTEHPGVYTIE